MVDFLIGAVKVAVGWFFAVKFIARLLFTGDGYSSAAKWSAGVFAIAFAIMLINRLIGSDVTVPAVTVFVFAMSLNGIDIAMYDSSPEAKRMRMIGLASSIVGGIAGWFLYMETCTYAHACAPILRPWL